MSDYDADIRKQFHTKHFILKYSEMYPLQMAWRNLRFQMGKENNGFPYVDKTIVECLLSSSVFNNKIWPM